MSDAEFKFPPGIRSAEEWAAGQSFCQSDVVAIQRDAVIATRREGTVFCGCPVPSMFRIRGHDQAQLCSMCDCELKERV